jgi:hypothetical protein
MRVGVLTLGLVLAMAGQAAAEWQVIPSFSISFGGGTTFVDAERAAGSANAVFGVRGVLLGEIFGVEADFGLAPGFFQRGLFGFGGDSPVPPGGGGNGDLDSLVTTLTGNVVVAVPRAVAEFTLRPYAVAGMGLMNVRINDLAVLPARSTLTALDVGGGMTGFLTDSVGLNWDFRRFWSVGGEDQELGFSIGEEQLSFWRASMGLAIRF